MNIDIDTTENSDDTDSLSNVAATNNHEMTTNVLTDCSKVKLIGQNGKSYEIMLKVK